MTTYNTYQEAKIANPDSDIYNDIKGKFQAIKDAPTSHFANGWELCKPQNYCMTVEKFLADGHKFVDGDIVQNHYGAVAIDCENIREWNHQAITKCDRSQYILRAAALEEKTSEKVEWANGDECEIDMQEGVRRYLFGCECPNNQQTCIVFTKDGGGHMVMPIERLLKPETKQQREDRERLEAAYDLYTHVQSVRGQFSCKSDWFSNSEMEETRLRFLAIVDKTNYRKEV